MSALNRTLRLFLVLISIVGAGCASTSENTRVPLTRAELVDAAESRTTAFIERCRRSCGLRLDPLSQADSVYVENEGRDLVIQFNSAFAQVPFRENTVRIIESELRRSLGASFDSLNILTRVDDVALMDLVPNYFRSMLPLDSTRMGSAESTRATHVFNASRPIRPDDGLLGNHIAIWPSHGWYFESAESRWEWQRARLFQTVEDLLPMSFIAPYLAPMLERAGARVYLPRERDPQVNEAVVDNDRFDGDFFEGGLPVHDFRENSLSSGDTSPRMVGADTETGVPSAPGEYRESDDLSPHFRSWTTGRGAGYGHGDGLLRGAENPFMKGTYRVVETDSVTSASVAWIPDIPEVGEYAVYVAYARLENAAPDAHYTVHHLGGETEFLIDQRMGGGTWTYLGTFPFEKGSSAEHGMVTLENQSDTEGTIVSADAVRFGGGMGTVVRGESTSGRPRYTEGARYYMQYSGMPDTLVYNVTETLNDYVDDYRGRAEWVNYLHGAPSGPNKERDHSGLGIPIDVSLAFHTDAGISGDDSTIGTLMIYSRAGYESETYFPGGVSRLANRDLGDIMQTQIVNDLRALYDSTWTRRAIWDRDYSEAVRPNVPGVLLELLSHQNFADMKFALDPAFRFDVGRAIYKSMLKFMARQAGRTYTVQPLAVSHVGLEIGGSKGYRLSWEAESDPLEPTADPSGFIVYAREAGMGWDNGRFVSGTSLDLDPPAPGSYISFRVSAVNSGGESVPSSVVSAGVAAPERVRRSTRYPDGVNMLILDAFTRIAPPGVIDAEDFKGFFPLIDEGISDGSDVAYVGDQYDFEVDSAYKDDDAPGHGASFATYEDRPRYGNTFDFAVVHGRAALDAGVSFVTMSSEAAEDANMNWDRFAIVDLLLGEQRTTRSYGNRRGIQFRTVSDPLKARLTTYVEEGGSLFVSGSYVGEDLTTRFATEADRVFARNVLRIRFQTGHGSQTGRLVSPSDDLLAKNEELSFNVNPAGRPYRVESPDAILPANSGTKILLRYAENNSSAAVGARGAGGAVVLGFPFETIDGLESRGRLMSAIVDFLLE